MLNAVKHHLTTLLPMSLLASLSVAANHAYSANLFDSLIAGCAVVGAGWVAAHFFIPVWSAIRVKRFWALALGAQWLLLVVASMALVTLLVTTPHGEMPRGCGLGATGLVVMMMGWLVVYLPAATLTTWVIHRRTSRLRQAADEV